MILEGLKLMLIGMGIVFFFLILLMVLMIISSAILKQEPVQQKSLALEGDKKFKDLIPIISAAVSAYKSKKKIRGE